MTADPASILPPRSGLIASRITLEYGGYEEFTQGLERALARSGARGATVVAYLDRGDIATHLPGQDAPCWNAVPLVHLRAGEVATADEWGTANAVLEKLERYR
ncbi:MAG TPA: hypothetical protein VKU35_02335 [Candidatus Limnocylindria bacterium]|nr:hypothetical protein [Candidatus Limnocylindria bacterium]